jgi:CRISPR type III-A-associated protein Csm2
MNKYWNEFNPKWLSKIDDDTIEWAMSFGGNLAKQVNRQRDSELTTNQLRKFFGEIKRQQIKGYKHEEFILLNPKLAYAVAKKGKRDAKINDFYFVFSRIMNEVKDEIKFKNFIKIFESVVAYHKASELINI